MQTTYNTTKSATRLSNIRILGYLMIGVGAIRLYMADFGSTAGIIDYVATSIPAIIGIILATTLTKSIKFAQSNQIVFDGDKLTFWSRGKGATFNTPYDIDAITIKLKTIDIKGKDSSEYQIFIDDYSDFADKKSIKSDFEAYNQLIKTKPNN